MTAETPRLCWPGPWAPVWKARGNLSTPADDMPSDDTLDRFEAGLKPLWLRAQAGDEVAYREALARMATRLRRYFRGRLQAAPDEVEDLVQETLLAVHLQRGTHDPTLPVSAWLLAIGRHKLVDLWRRRGRRDDQHDPLDDGDGGAQDEALQAAPDGHEARRDLERLLQALPEAQRQAIWLTKVEGLSVEEASQQTGASVSALKVQVHRGLKRLAALVQGGKP